jgi:hypothetical protein
MRLRRHRWLFCFELVFFQPENRWKKLREADMTAQSTCRRIQG